MKKSLIALAVAGVCAAPAAFAASANVDFYGKFRVSLDNINKSVGWQMSDETSRIGFKGAEDLGGGLKAIYQWESGFNIGTSSATVVSTGNAGSTYTSGSSLAGQRNTFVGLAGDFGTVLAGRADTPYKMVGSAELFGDTLADAQNGSALLGFSAGIAANRCIICEDIRVGNAVAYVSPNFSGVTVMAATVVGNGTAASTNDIVDAYSLGATYANGGLKLGVAYENLDKVANYSNKPAATKLTGSYTIDALTLGATYEQLKNIAGVSGAKSNDWLVSAAYGMGPVTLAAQYGNRNANSTAGDNNDLKDLTVGVVYSLSKRTSTYLGYAHYTGKASDLTVKTGSTNAITLGLNHDF